MRKSVLTVAILSAFGAASAAIAADAPASPHTVSFNAGLATEYSYRGISQSDNKPALSAGADYSHASGLYVGTWASTIKWLEELGFYDKSKVEIDVYGGYKYELAKDVVLDAGVLKYVYPGTKPATTLTANTTEVYAAFNYQFAGLKYSHSVTDLFGTGDSKGSGYLDLYLNYDLPIGVQLNLHVGKTKVKNSSGLDYTDYKLGVTKDFGFATGAIAYIKATGNAVDGTKATDALNGTEFADWYKGRLVATITKTF